MLRSLVLAAALLVGVAAEAQPTRPRPGQVIQDCFVCPAVVVLPTGGFQMGTRGAENGAFSNEAPSRYIRLRRPFAVGVTEVTRGQYAAFASATNRADGGGCFREFNGDGLRAYDPQGSWREPGFPQSDDHPVVCVSWEDAQAYVAWLSRRTGQGYRLLTEAEWEYAARAGSGADYPWGRRAEDICLHANGADAALLARGPTARETLACNDGAARTAPVGRYRPNRFGLVDMIGNATEWTEDCWGNTLGGIPRDGGAVSWQRCEYRTFRGGLGTWAR